MSSSSPSPAQSPWLPDEDGERTKCVDDRVSCDCAGDDGMLMDCTPRQMGFVCVRGYTGEVSGECVRVCVGWCVCVSLRGMDGEKDKMSGDKEKECPLPTHSTLWFS